MSVKARNFIDGQESDAAGGRTLENFEPATGRAYGTVADSSAEDVSRAVELSVFGERAVALGSDYPFPLGEERPGELIRSMTSLSEGTRERLLRGTALEWLGAAGAKLGGAR